MRNFVITIVTAATIVGAFLLLRAVAGGARDLDADRPIRPPAPAEGAPESRAELPAPSGAPATIAGLPELEALHRQHGAVGAAMRDLLALARGAQWNQVDRARVQEALHAVRNNATEDDVAYLVDLFNRTEDPAFRWWFSWLVQQIPDERFIEAMTEVYRLDPHRGLDALASINKPAATERYLRLLESETDPDVRLHAVTALAHSDWDRREEMVSEIARDSARAGPERIEALAALGRVGVTADSMALLMEVALGPAKPVSGLKGSLAVSHPVPDLRSGAVLAIMQRGDQEAGRRLIEAADAPGADPEFTRIVDLHIASFMGPDLSELIYDRARRRGFVSAGEVSHLLRDPANADRARLRDLVPLVKDAAAKALLEKVVSGG